MHVDIFPAVCSCGTKRSNNPDSLAYKRVPFIIKDSPPSLFTMKQFNQNYLSLYRLSVNELNRAVSPRVSALIQVGMSIAIPITHEEGHRAILTTNHIGSVSNPFSMKTLLPT